MSSNKELIRSLTSNAIHLNFVQQCPLMYCVTHTDYISYSEKAAHIVPKRLEEFRERTQPQLGKVHDPIKDTMNVPPDHTFGVLFKPDEYGAGDLIHGRTPDRYMKGHEHQRAVLARVRQQLKKLNYHNFSDLKSAFQFYDKVCEEWFLLRYF